MAQRQSKRNQRHNDKRKEVNGVTAYKSTNKEKETNDATKNKGINGSTASKKKPTAQQQIKKSQKRNDEHKIINGTTTNKKNATAHRHRETASRTVIINRHHGPANQLTNQNHTANHQSNQYQNTPENTHT